MEENQGVTSSPLERTSWFRHFGSLPSWPDELGEAFLEAEGGFIETQSLEGRLQGNLRKGVSSISLVPFNPGVPLHPSQFSADRSIKELAKALEEGMEKQQASSRLHEQLVRQTAMELQKSGAKIFHDPNSFDLLARWPDNFEAAFEAKTLASFNTTPRIRLAVGQILEYTYRYRMQLGGDIEKGLIVNRPIDDALIRRFLAEEIQSNVFVYGEHGAERTYCANSQLLRHVS